MSLEITAQPFAIDFAGNSPKFQLLGAKYETAGGYTDRQFRVTKMPTQTGVEISISFLDKTITFTTVANETKAKEKGRLIPIATGDGTDKNNIVYLLTNYIANDFYLNKYFDVSVSNLLNLFIILTFKTKEKITPELLQLTIDTDQTQAIFSNSSTLHGRLPISKKNYALLTQFLVNNNTTPEMVIHVAENSRATQPITILLSYFNEPDIPVYNKLVAPEKLSNAYLKYRLKYAEFFGNPIEVQYVHTSDEKILLPGTIDNVKHLNNLPDWENPTMPNISFSEYDNVRELGCDSGLTVSSYVEAQQLLYLMLFNSASAHNNINFSVFLVFADGATKKVVYPDMQIENNAIYRLSISFHSLNLSTHQIDSEIISYTVSVTLSPGKIWKRTFILHQKPFFAKEFYFQNRYGLLEPFFAESMVEEKVTTGEENVLNQDINIDYSESETIYTVSTGYKSPREMRLLSECVDRQYNYIFSGRQVRRIIILPDSYTIHDENEELQSAQFQFKLSPLFQKIEPIIETETFHITTSSGDRLITNNRENYITQN